VTPRVPVRCGVLSYRAAVAELPLRTRQARDAPDAVAVIPGEAQWCDRVRRAAAAGARGVVVSRPAVVPAAEIRELSAEIGELPLIVERMLFRPDAAFDVAAGRATTGSSEVRLVAVDGAALAGEAGVVLRDAIAWARVLTGSPLAWDAASAGLAFSKGPQPGDVPVALNVVEISAGGSWIRAHALGEVRSELEATADRTVVSTTRERGAMVAPARFESPQRLALRRALNALEGGDQPLDLTELAADVELAEQLTAKGSL
jgi:hypothetical protein